MNKIFKGVVNGKEFTDITEYNLAIMKAINSGEPISTSCSYEETSEDCKCEKKEHECNCNCNCNGNCNCTNKEKLTSEQLGHLCPRYVYGTLDKDIEKNEIELKKITKDLDTRFDEFIGWLENCTCECEIDRVYKRIVDVTTELEDQTIQISENYKQLEEKAHVLREELEKIENAKKVMLQEGRIVEDIIDYYENVQIELGHEDENKTDLQSNECESNFKEKTPQKDYSLCDLFSNNDNILDNILENIEPGLDDKSKENIKKQANELINQFDRILRCF